MSQLNSKVGDRNREREREREKPFEKEERLPEGAQKYLDQMTQDMIAQEKEGYHNDLVPFSQHADAMKAQAQEKAYLIYSQIQRAQSILRHELELEEATNKEIPQEARFASWEAASIASEERMNSPDFSEEQIDAEKSMQEQLGVSQAFMQRAYTVAKKLIQDKRFEEAVDVFVFLRFLNASVFDYWLGEAISLHELGKLQEAVEAYKVCAYLHPESAYALFQMASCLYRLNEIEPGLEAITACIECAKQDAQQEELLKRAVAMQHALESKKAA